MPTPSLDHYERRAVNDLHAWVVGGRPPLGGLGEAMATATGRLGRPVGRAAGRLLDDPRIARALTGAMDRSLQGLTTFMVDATPAGPAAGAYGLPSADGIAGLHLREVDAVLRRVGNRHRAAIIGLGAAEGVAGLAWTPVAVAAFVASIPALQAASLRAVADLARHAGFDPADFGERQLIADATLRSLEVGGSAHTEAVTQMLGLGGRPPPGGQLSRVQQQQAIRLLGERAQRAGLQLTRRRTTALLPVVGAALGAGFNAVHAGRLVGGATMLYRARHLARTHDLSIAELLESA